MADLQGSFRRLAAAATTLDKKDLLEADRLCEGFKEWQRAAALELVGRARGQPALLHYEADCTSFLTEVTGTSQTSGLRVVRKGLALQELLSQRGHLRTRLPSGEDVVVLLHADSLPMDHGKRATHHFVAACNFWPMLRRVGHEGISIFALSADRAILAPLDRLLRQRQAAFYALGGVAPELESRRPLLQATDWHVACGCAAHDAHNAFR
jgi:hypothetical protein